jgi:hypothetical protein
VNNLLQCVIAKTYETNIYILLKINSKLIAAGGQDGKIRLISAVNLDCTDIFDCHKSDIQSMIKYND